MLLCTLDYPQRRCFIIFGSDLQSPEIFLVSLFRFDFVTMQQHSFSHNSFDIPTTFLEFSANIASSFCSIRPSSSLHIFPSLRSLRRAPRLPLGLSGTKLVQLGFYQDAYGDKPKLGFVLDMAPHNAEELPLKDEARVVLAVPER